MAEEKIGILLGGAPSIEKLYDSGTGRALLMPHLPLNPPPPKSEGIKLAIIDSGVIACHPQLRGLVIAEKAFAGTDPADHIGHGTAVALQFLRRCHEGNQTSSPVIISANVVGSRGAPTLSAVVNAIHWVIAQGARVVNMSLGFMGSGKEFEDLCQTIASYKEVIFCAAAGNSGPEAPFYPAACCAPNLMAVGETRNGVPTSTSGTGQIYAEGTVDLVEPWAYYLENGLQAARDGDFNAASRNFENSLAEKENPEAMIQLALLELHKPQQNLEAAYQMLERTARLAPDFSPIHTHLGAIRFIQGRYYDAETHLNKALTIDPYDQMARFNLGQTLLGLRRPNDALAAFEKVRELNPSYPRIEAAIASAREESGMASTGNGDE